MASLGRFILRVLLVPLGASLAIVVAATVIVVAHWGDFIALMQSRPDVEGYWLLVVVIIGPALAILLAFGVAFTVLPASVGVLISEAFAIRSWIFHIANGGLSAWIGWILMADLPKDYHFLAEPKVIVAAGLAAGAAYWLIAGWSAGFWKPVFAPAQLPPPPPAPVP
ncbi:MAG TPA: hypothetical protein VKX28_13735 [Xanthobacteraceae bacterium]|nr:hypothetical protein [Xanthobacteraceae bacterium]